AQEIALLERPMLAAIDARQLSLGRLQRCVKLYPPPLTVSLTQEAIVKNRVQPTAQMALRATQVPAGKRTFETILDEIIGALTVSAQQRTSKSPQTGNVRLDQRGLISHCTIVATIRSSRGKAHLHRYNSALGRHHRRSVTHVQSYSCRR